MNMLFVTQIKISRITSQSVVSKFYYLYCYWDISETDVVDAYYFPAFAYRRTQFLYRPHGRKS